MKITIDVPPFLERWVTLAAEHDERSLQVFAAGAFAGAVASLFESAACDGRRDEHAELFSEMLRRCSPTGTHYDLQTLLVKYLEEFNAGAEQEVAT